MSSPEVLISRQMTPETASLASDLHRGSPRLTAEAFCYEYFSNPDVGSRLYYGVDGKGTVVASQAFVGQTLIRNGLAVPTLMSERTFLAPALRGKVNYATFYHQALRESVHAASAYFIWGGTSALKAFQRFGFETIDCFVSDALVFRLQGIFRALALPHSWKSRAFHATLYSLSLAKHWLSLAWTRTTPWTVAEEMPSEDELRDLLSTVSRTHADTYFMRYTPAKLAWFATNNPYAQRKVLTIRRAGALDGIAIVEYRDDAARSRDYFLTLGRHQAQRDISGLRFWGNGQNAYVATLRSGLVRLGSVPLRKIDAQLVIRGPEAEGGEHPPASALAMTWIWQPPV
jgi:hypothetical protein